MSSCSCSGAKLCTQNIPLFSNLPFGAQKKLVSQAIHSDIKRGDTLINEGDVVDEIKIIRNGRIKLNRYDSEGKEYILDILVPGDTIGEDLFFESTNYSYNAICITSCKLCTISKETFINFIREEPEVAWNLIKTLTGKLRKSNERVELLHENDAMKRIIRFFFERNKRVKGQDINLTIDDIAASTNLRRETVSRKISDLQKINCIERVGHGKIKIIDEEELMNILNS